MQTVIRQDGSAVELSDKDAAAWIKRGLATAQPIVEPATKPATKPAWSYQKTPEPIQTNEGV